MPRLGHRAGARFAFTRPTMRSKHPMMRKKHEQTTPEVEARHALTECPAPWEPIDRGTDASYRRLVERHGPWLLEHALGRPEARSWLLVRYLPEVPDVLVEWSLASFRRESAAFSELVGGVPELSKADTWEAQWRATRGKAGGRRRAAS